MSTSKTVAEARSTSKDIAFWLVGIIFPLVTGFLLYAIFRPDSTIYHIINPIVPSFFNGNTYINNTVVRFIQYYASDMLWAYSLTFTISLIIGQSRRQIWLATGLTLLLETIFELLQNYHVVSGVFDPLDITLEILSTIMAIIIIIIHHRRIPH